MNDLFTIRSEYGSFWSETLLGLIEGVYELHAPRARSILRKRIECSREPTFSEQETVKVAAKRIRVNPTLSSTETKSLGTHLARPPIDLPKTDKALPRYQQDREVQARLIGADGKTLLETKNTNGKIRTRHAEMNLIDHYGKKFPRGSKLIVTLKPCRMCAALIWENAESIEDFRVIYIENDPGRLAQGTLLDAESPARLRAFGKDSAFYTLKIQEQIKQNA